jgi:multiple sugar transport system permease protein
MNPGPVTTAARPAATGTPSPSPGPPPAGAAARRVLLWTVVLPLAVVSLLAVLRLGTMRRAAAVGQDVAFAIGLLDAYDAERAALAALPGAVEGPALYGGPVEFLRQAQDAGYDAALYVAGERVRAMGRDVGPPVLPAELAERLLGEDRPFPLRLEDGRGGIVAPVKDLDDWDIVGALLAAPRAPPPARLPALPLGMAVVALALTVPLVRRFPARPSPLAAALLYLPAVALGLFLLTRSPGEAAGTEAAAVYPIWVAGLFGAWGVLAAIGLSLARLAARPVALREGVRAWAFLGPSLAHLLLFAVGPILFALYLSFHEWNLVEPARPFIGLENYRELLNDAPFWRSVLNTGIYVLFVPVAMVVALALALLVNRRIRGVRLLRTVFFLPYVTSFVAISLIWKWMFEPEFGLLNYLLTSVGLPPQPWLTSPATAMPSLMLMSIWIFAGYMMVLFLAGLQNIPESLYESARIDGAGPWQRFRWITLPMLRPTTFFVLVTMVIFMFQVFTAVYVMTEGGPLHATDVIVYHIYRTAWEYLRMGYASAMAWVLFLIVFLITMVQFRYLGGRTAHE